MIPVEKKERAIDFSQRFSPEKKKDILTHVEQETRKIFEQMSFLPVHDITHVERVVKNTRLICEGEGVDSFLPEIAAWLHDIGRLNAEDDSLLAIILKDADRLDGIGAIGFPRVFAFYPEKPIYDLDNPFGLAETSEEYLRYSGQSTQIRALYRNMEWFSCLRTKTAIKLGIPKIKLMIEFLHQLADELGVSQEKVDNLPVVQKAKKVFQDRRYKPDPGSE